MEWMLMPFKRYFEFTGRSRRMEYWMFALFNVIVYIVLAVIAFGLLGAGDAFSGGVDPADPFAIYGGLLNGAGIIIGLYGLAVFIPSIAVGVRRLHDRDMSGWWYLGFVVASLIPFVGFIASIAFLVLMFLPGTEGPNRFGPDPKDPSNAAVFD